jgi:hypothetical protein
MIGDNLDPFGSAAIGLVHGDGQLLADDGHFRRRFNADAHAAMTDFDNGDGNFVTD